MPNRRSLILALSICVLSCDSRVTPDVVAGTYVSTRDPALVLELSQDGSVVEKIDGRELRGRWGLWSTTATGCGVITSRVELTGLVFTPGEPQTNNRIDGAFQRWPSKLVLRSDGQKLEFHRASTPR
jgi:hypothetical protein